MPWIQSHDNLASHPKTRRAARMAGVSVPTMIGHLHMLWHWTLGVAPDGDLSRFEADDLADACMYEGDPDQLVASLVNCGPGESFGFLEPTFQLHDWAEYGGRYKARSDAGKKGAAARWAKKPRPADQPEHANALRTHSDANGDRNAEERRGEENRPNPSPSLAVVPVNDPSPSAPVTRYHPTFEAFWEACPRKTGKGAAARAFTKITRHDGAKAARIIEAMRSCAEAWATWPATDRQYIPHPATWLNEGRYDDPPPEPRAGRAVGSKADESMQRIAASLERAGGAS